MKIYKYHDLFTQTETQNGYPFNIIFEDKEDIERSEMHGPGIYLISFKNKVVYLGKYRPINAGNVLSQRWIHHVATLTGRGHKVGFGSADRWLNRFKEIFDQYGINISDLSERKKDTGTVTSLKRIKFSFENFHSFKDELEMSTFKFHYYRNDGIPTKKLDQIETYLIKAINPPANHQYDEDLKVLSLKDALQLIELRVTNSTNS